MWWWAALTAAILASAARGGEATVATPRSLAAASATAARPSPLLSEGRASLAAFERERAIRQAAHAKRAAAEEDVADALRPSFLRLVARAVWLAVVFSPVSSTAWLAALSPTFRVRAWYPLLAACLGRSGAYVKELHRLPRWYSTLLVDDNEDTYKLNTSKGFAVWHIPPFVADSLAAESACPPDEELARVEEYIRHVLDAGGRFERRPKDKYRAVRACMAEAATPGI